MDDWVQFLTQEEGVWIVVGTAILGIFLILWILTKRETKPEPEEPDEQETKKAKKKPVRRPKKRPKPVQSKKKKKDVRVDHKLFIAALKGHTGAITQVRFSKNGKFFMSTSVDKTIRLFPFKRLGKGNIQPHRIDLGYDYAAAAAFTSDGKHLVASVQNKVKIYKFVEEEIGNKKVIGVKVMKEWDTSAQHKDDIVQLDVSRNNQFIFTMSVKDTVATLYDLSGKVLSSFPVRKLHNNYGCVSNNSRFIAIATFTGDVRIYEVLSATRGENAGSFKEVKKVMDCGHKKNVTCVDISLDEKFVVTGSKSKVVKLWNIDVRYQVEEDPKVVYELNVGDVVSLVKISKEQRVIAVITENAKVIFYSFKDGKKLDEVQLTSDISDAAWSNDSMMFAVASDNITYLFSNPNNK